MEDGGALRRDVVDAAHAECLECFLESFWESFLQVIAWKKYTAALLKQEQAWKNISLCANHQLTES
jgi:hypothetical protein